ncbi:MAG: phosphoribosyltransferase [Acidobacteriota bacterium]|nr:phosphoribosyltransferase [Acidobacteriota bacterium]
MVDLIPSPESVMEILEKTGAYRQGHFVYPSGKHASHYFQMPLAFRYYDNSRVLSVGLSRKFRMNKAISSRLPKISIISPSPGGIPVAFAVREALSAEQIYWAEIEDGKRQFRQYLKDSDIHPCIIVDDIIRSGRAVEETIKLVKELGAEILGIGTIVKFEDVPDEIEGIKIEYLTKFDVNFFNSLDEWKTAEGNDSEEETVRF